jgi:competence protein ComEC
MRLNVLFFVAGVWLLQQQAVLPNAIGMWGLAAVIAAGLVMTVAGRGGKSLPAAVDRGTSRAASRLIFVSRFVPWRLALRAARRLLVVFACFAAGFAWAALIASARLADTLSAEWEGRDVRVEGVVASLPQPYERSLRFEFDIERVLTEHAVVPQRIVLSWWGTPPRENQPASTPELLPGERWQLTVRLRRPHGVANPHGFDYEAWLIERNLRAVGHVRPRSGNQRLGTLVHRPQYWVERARNALRSRILAALPAAPYAGVIAALAIGDQRAIPPDQWQIFTRTGVNHLMSISGLHVTMVSGLLFALVQALWRRSPRLATRLPAPKAAAIAGLVTAFAYALLAGFAVPAQRTVYMLCVIAFALWIGFVESPSVVLAVALVVVVLIDPWAVLSAGFWLSFGAIAAIMYVCSGRARRAGWFSAWARVQLAVTLAMIPVLLGIFQQMSIVSPVANAIAIPVVGLVVVPLTLIGMVMPFDGILQLAHQVMALSMLPLEWWSGLEAAVWEQRAPPAWAVIVGTCGALLALAPRGLPGRWLGLAGMLPLFFAASPALPTGALQVTVLDVGQGIATLVRTANHALLYDTGPSFGPQIDSGNRVIVPFLRAIGVTRLDGMIVSHGDADHAGGAASVLQAMPVEWLLTSLPDPDPLLMQADRAFHCHAGQAWEWDQVRFEILHPLREIYEGLATRENDRSCVLLVSAPGARLLLPGDIERRSETALTERLGDALRAEILLAPHHGSRTSSIPQFVEAVSPQFVVFPVGYRNRFRQPHYEVSERYESLGTRVYRSDRDGAIMVDVSPGGAVTITPYRSIYRRYWQTEMVGDPVPDKEQFSSTNVE